MIITLPINTLHTIKIFGGTKQELLDTINLKLNSDYSGKSYIIFTPNPEQLVLSYHNADFLEYLHHADCNLPDGQGLVWAINRKIKDKKKKIVRIPGREIMHDLLKSCLDDRKRIFLLGGSHGSAEAIVKKYELLGLRGRLSYDLGFLDIKMETKSEQEHIFQKLERFKPDVLFVAYGAPWQEGWVIKNKSKLSDIGIKVILVVGGAFEYESGKALRVPQFFQTHGLEWLIRLLSEPWRWKRQLKGCEFFLKEIFN